MSHERRQSIRIPLDSLYFVEIDFARGTPITGLIMDISSGGLMIGLPPTASENIEPDVGEKGIIRDSSQELAHVFDKNLPVTVMWVKEGLCGIGFDLPQPKVNLAFETMDFK